MSQRSLEPAKNNVLILCPSPYARGGVSNYYMLVRQHFYSKKISLSFCFTGMSNKKGVWIRIFRIISDMWAIPFVIARHDLIVLNPSLDFKSIVRDGYFQLIAKYILRKKTVIFFRGWHLNFEGFIDKHGRKLFRTVMNPEKIIVLGDQIKKKLLTWGYDPNRIIVETTAFVQYQFNICNDPFKFIFLGRVSDGKGCFEAIKIIELMVYEYPMIKLFVVGDGKLLGQMKHYVVMNNLSNNIKFTGWIKGKKKYKLLSQCGVMLLPSHEEGLPNCILEAMGYGLVVVTRPVGGIPDVIANGENGFLIESLDPIDFVVKIEQILHNPKTFREISKLNRQEAAQKYEIKKVVNRLEHIFMNVIQNSD